MKLTAEQARSLSKSKNIDEKLTGFLDVIYLAIEKSAREGETDFFVSLKPWASSHKEYIFTSFRNNGYKVEFKTYNYLRDGCDDEYFIVSWKE